MIRFCQIGRCNRVAEFHVDRAVPRGIVRQLLGLDCRWERVWTCEEHQIDSLGQLRNAPRVVLTRAKVRDEDLARALQEWR